jgi:hypothetical protein
MVTALLCACAILALAGSAGEVYYPDGYHLWTVAKFKLIGPENPNYEKQGGFRHHFANETALASWGRFRDGAVIVDERVHATLNAQNIRVEGELAHVAVMRKDSKLHADTGGWYFNFFSGNDTAIGITPAQAKSRCFEACHQAQAARDYVFSDPRR